MVAIDVGDAMGKKRAALRINEPCPAIDYLQPYV